MLQYEWQAKVAYRPPLIFSNCNQNEKHKNFSCDELHDANGRLRPSYRRGGLGSAVHPTTCLLTGSPDPGGIPEMMSWLIMYHTAVSHHWLNAEESVALGLLLIPNQTCKDHVQRDNGNIANHIFAWPNNENFAKPFFLHITSYAAVWRLNSAPISLELAQGLSWFNMSSDDFGWQRKEQQCFKSVFRP